MSIRDALERSSAAHYLRRLFGTTDEKPLVETPPSDPGTWTACNVAAVREGGDKPMRVATNGRRIRIRCGDCRFDPPIEMDADDFQAIMAAAILAGLKPFGDVVLERQDLTPNV